MCHVLVIEDDLLIADHIIQLVESAGATSVDHADSEAGAVAAALASPPAIIMSDVQLTEGTGPAAVQQIIEKLGALPVIFVTGTPEACQPCDPPMIILAKPIEENVLVQAFRSMAPV